MLKIQNNRHARWIHGRTWNIGYWRAFTNRAVEEFFDVLRDAFLREQSTFRAFYTKRVIIIFEVKKR